MSYKLISNHTALYSESEYDISNVAILNVTEITIVKHSRLSNYNQRESSTGSTPTLVTQRPDQTKC